MLNSTLNLAFDALNLESLPQRATRDGFGQGIVEAAERDTSIVVLCADVVDSTRLTAFKERFPDRYIEFGVAEQNMAGVAAGLAAAGKIPFIVSYAIFNPGRNWEQIRTTIALNDVPVKIVGMHAGVVTGPDGATHQALEDVTLMRVLPNMEVIVPADAEEARKATLALAWSKKPAYLRFFREPSPVFTTPETPFERSRALLLWESSAPEVLICGAGPILAQALRAARTLADGGTQVSVLNLHSLKPMDIPAFLEHAARAGAVVTVEDHQILGGLGGTVAEVLAQNTPLPVEMVAVHDRFGQSGTPSELTAHYGLDASAIVRAVERVKGRKARV